MEPQSELDACIASTRIKIVTLSVCGHWIKSDDNLKNMSRRNYKRPSLK